MQETIKFMLFLEDVVWDLFGLAKNGESKFGDLMDSFFWGRCFLGILDDGGGRLY